MTQEHNPFDRTFREILKELPKRFTEIIFKSKVVEVYDPTFPKVKERIADFVGKLEDGKIVIVEVLSSKVKDLSLRLADLYLRAIEKYRTLPLLLLLWLGERRCPYSGTFRIGSMRFKVLVKELRKLSCRELLESEDPGDAVLAVLCQRGKDFWERMKERYYRLPQEKRGEFLVRLGILARLRSGVVLEYERFAGEVNEMPIVIDVKRDPYYKRGYKEGKKEGLLLDAQEMVLEALEEKFGTVEESLRQRIKELRDRAFLKRIHRLIFRVNSLDEILKEIEAKI